MWQRSTALQQLELCWQAAQQGRDAAQLMAVWQTSPQGTQPVNECGCRATAGSPHCPAHWHAVQMLWCSTRQRTPKLLMLGAIIVHSTQQACILYNNPAAPGLPNSLRQGSLSPQTLPPPPQGALCRANTNMLLSSAPSPPQHDDDKRCACSCTVDNQCCCCVCICEEQTRQGCGHTNARHGGCLLHSSMGSA